MPTDFTCVIDTDGTPSVAGVDFASLAAWYAALGGTTLNLLTSDVPGAGAAWVVPGTLAGAIAAGATVTQVGTGSTATLIYHNQAGQALLKATGTTQPNDSGAWRVDASNFWTPTGPRDVPVLVASCRGATPDSSVLTFTGLIANGLVNPITIRGNLDPAALVWNATRYRLEGDTLGAVLACVNATNNSLRLQGLQVRNVNTATGSWTNATAALDTDGAVVLAEGCLFRGGQNAVYHRAGGGVGRTDLENCVAYGASQAAVLHAGSTPLIVRNSTLIGGSYGLRNTSHGDALVENTYVHGSVAACSTASDGVNTLDHAASSDATGSPGYRAIPHSTATFRGVTAGSEDYRLALGSALGSAGADLSVGRSRCFADVSSANEFGNGGPVGFLEFTSGSATALFRLWNSTSDRWWDGTGNGLNRFDLTLAIPLLYPSTTSDVVALISDTHEGPTVKSTVLPGIDAVNAGTKGRWTKDTSHGWALNSFPLAGRVNWLINLGDLQVTDQNRYGDTLNYYRDNLFNTSGNAAGGGIASIAADHIFHYTGNHDIVKAKRASALEPANPAFEEMRFNQHGRTTDLEGNAYSDASELRQWFDVGNHRFLLGNYYGTGTTAQTYRSTGVQATWLQADVDWYVAAIAAAGAGARNLFVMMHAPLTQSTRKSFQNQLPSPIDVALARSPWAASFCGHTHAFGSTLPGPDAGSIGTRQDYPTRTDWSIGAGTPSPIVPPRRPVRVAGRSIRGIRV
jgi:hypothetical protein